MRNDYEFAELSNQAIRALRQLESKLAEEAGEEITLIAYEQRTEPGTTACRASTEGE